MFIEPSCFQRTGMEILYLIFTTSLWVRDNIYESHMMSKPWHRVIKSLSQGHTESKWWGQRFHPWPSNSRAWTHNHCSVLELYNQVNTDPFIEAIFGNELFISLSCHFLMWVGHFNSCTVSPGYTQVLFLGLMILGAILPFSPFFLHARLHTQT